MSRQTGVLFLIPLLSYSIGNALMDSVLDADDVLTALAEREMIFAAGALLVFLNSCAVTALGVVCYPLLRKYSRSTALFYLCVRVMEALILILGLVFLLSAQQLAESAPPFRDEMFPLLRSMQFRAYQCAMLLLAAGGVFFCYGLGRIRALPLFLSVWGICGYALLGLGSLLEFFGFPLSIFFSLPGGLFELFLGIWLLLKGFRAEAELSLSAG